MVEVETVILKVASRCNIDCRYCYVFNMGDSGWSRAPKQMSRETCRATTKALAVLSHEQGRPFAVVLHGGEPLLLGYDNLQYMLSELRRSLPVDCAISIQTNGMLITREILDLCSSERVTINVKRIERFWREEGLGLPSRRKRHRACRCEIEPPRTCGADDVEKTILPAHGPEKRTSC